MMKTKFILLLMTLIATTSWSQNISIKGRVLETTSEPVPFATVSVLTPDSALVTGTTSDTKGDFVVTGLKKGDYLLSISYVGYMPVGIELKNLVKNIEIGEVVLQENSVALAEVTVSASNITQKIDRQIILPTESQLKRSFGAYDLLNNMMISRLQVDPLMNTMSVSGGGSVQVRINGVKVTSRELAAVRAKDVRRIEYIEDPGKRYGDENLGAVVNIILKQRETGGRINLQATDSPHVLWGENFVSGKFNYKNSEWGIDYFNKNSKNHYRKELTEHYELGDKVIDRVQEGVDDASERLTLHNDINLSYNLTKPDKYIFNAVFRNSIENVPYNNQLNRMSTPGSTDYIFSQSKTHTSSYSPSLDLYYQLVMPHDQSLEVNLTGTLINTTSNRDYNEYTRADEDLAGIQTYVDGKKRSVIGEVVYDKSFKNIKLSAGARHYQMRAENTYTGTNPILSEMNQAQTSAFFELQGKVKDFTYAGSVGMTRAWFKESGEDHQYFTFTPTIRLGLNLHKAGFLRYRFNVSPSIPSLSSLTDVEQALDTIQIVRGNPRLKTFRKYSNSLNYNLSFKKVGINFSARYNYYDKPIMESLYVEDGKLVMMDENQRYFQDLNFELGVNVNSLSIGSLKDFMSLGLSAGYTDTWSRGKNYSHRYDNFYCNAFFSLQYRHFMLMGQYRKFQNALYGETIRKGENQTVFMLAYARQNFQVGAGIMFPFTNNYRTGEERISRIAPYHSWQYVKEAGQMVMLRLSYGIEFGRKHKAGNKKLNNVDKESGIINTDR